jgi:tetratricopeptide (TPR) repeat protein
MIAIASAAAWCSFSLHRSWPLRELPEIDLSRADPQVKTAIDKARLAVVASPRSSAAWGDLAQFLAAHGFQEEAVVCLAQAARFDPHEFLWPYLRGDLLSARDPAEAELCFREAARLRPGLALPRLRLGELFLERRGVDQAAAEFEAAIRIEPASARAMYGLGAVAFHRGDFAEASRWVRQSFARDPEHRRTVALLLRVVHRLGDQEAVARQQAVLDAMPPREVDWEDPFVEKVALKRRDLAGLAATATELIESGRLPEAISALERLVASNPENPQSYSLLGTTLIRRHDFAQAACVLDAGLARHPQSAELHFHRGVVHFFLEEWDSAAGQFRRAVELKPDFRDARYNLGHTLVKLGDRDGAIAAFREVARIRPDDTASYINLGKLLLESGDRHAARAALETAAKLAPQDAEVQQALRAVQNDVQNDEAK